MELTKGDVKLRYVFPENADQAIVDAARLDKESKNPTKNLIEYMLRHQHTSPFEQVRVSFLVKAPLFVVQQWQRHRMASYQEESLRYVELEQLDCYKPTEFKKQLEGNHQGSSQELTDNQDILSQSYNNAIEACENHYQLAIEQGNSKEQARMVIPSCQYKHFIYTTDLHNFMRFLQLRLDSHAQAEIREYAQAMYDLVKPYAPLTMEAFMKYIFETIKFSREESILIGRALIYLRNGRYDFLRNNNLEGRELQEFIGKVDKLILMGEGSL